MYTKIRCWSTIGTDESLTFVKCILFISEKICFGELRHKPFATRRPNFVSAAPVYSREDSEDPGMGNELDFG